MKNNNIELKNIIENDLIIERGYGIFEGLTRQNIKDKYPDLYKEWLENENIKVEKPEFNKLIINENNTRHGTTMINYNAPEERLTLQIFFK